MHHIAILRRPQLAIAGVLAALLLASVSVGASSANLSRSYKTTTKVTNGSLVSLDASRSDAILPANSVNGERLVGVVTDSTDSLLAVNEAGGNVQVVTSGTVTALVSNLNGVIKAGDQIAVSPFNGVGIKAAAGNRIIGLAQTGFTGMERDAQKETVSTRAGNKREISVGYIRLNIGIGTATTAGTQEDLNSLQKLGRSLTGKTISTARIVVSLVIAVVALVALVTLIYASVFSGIISVGRNPLAKFSVFRTMSVVLAMAGGLALIASLTIFLILR